MRYVQAVVSCWGSVVAGTQGIARAARPHRRDLARRRGAASTACGSRSTASARIYADKAAMLAEHPLSVLPCYESPPQHRAALRGPVIHCSVRRCSGSNCCPLVPRRRIFLRCVTSGLTATVASAAPRVVAARRVARRRHLAAAVVVRPRLAAWLVAPMFGWAGWLLRLPLLRALLIAAGGYLLRFAPVTSRW